MQPERRHDSPPDTWILGIAGTINLKGLSSLPGMRVPPDKFCLVVEFLGRKESMLLFLSNIVYLYPGRENWCFNLYFYVSTFIIAYLVFFPLFEFFFFLFFFCILEISTL